MQVQYCNEDVSPLYDYIRNRNKKIRLQNLSWNDLVKICCHFNNVKTSFPITQWLSNYNKSYFKSNKIYINSKFLNINKIRNQLSCISSNHRYNVCTLHDSMLYKHTGCICLFLY